MDEFKRLPWSVSDFATDLHDTYAINMSAYGQRNPTDAFFSHLMELDPLHLQYVAQNSNEVVKNSPRQFVDPRTGVEIPSHECNYKNVELKLRNIFLANYVAVSKLQKHEHSACLNALRCSTKPASEWSTEEKRDCILHETTALHRAEEKRFFLEKLREHYFAEISNRYHKVPPSVDYFVTQLWKKKVITMYRQLTNDRYRMTTAISLQPSSCTVKMDVIHQEHLGCVPQMTHERVEYIRDSYVNLMKAYNQRKNTHFSQVIKEKVNELVTQHDIDFVVPVSVLKLLLNNKSGWNFAVTVKDTTGISSKFNAKEIIFEKPLPVAYMSGRDRYKLAAKYLLYSCLNRNSLNIYNRNEITECKTLIDSKTVECDSSTNKDLDYKISSCDEFMKKHSKSETLHENMTFTIFNVTGFDDSDDSNETFKMLVPAKQAAYKNGDDGEVTFLNYSPKIEYQAEYGGEEMTKEELIDEWCELFFKPNSMTERVRFDCVTGKVINRQSIPLVILENELTSKYGIGTQLLLQTLWQAFQTFIMFPDGDYLLQCDSKTPANINVYEKSNSAEALEISKIVKNVKFERDLLLDKANWQPIDEKIVTEIHDKFQILPCAFPHSEYLIQYRVKPAKAKRSVQTKLTKNARQRLKICPQDDYHGIVNRIRSKKIEAQKRIASLKRNTKYKNKKKNRERKIAEKAKQQKEIEEFEALRKLMTTTTDEYDAGTTGRQNTNSSIGTRGRRQSKLSDSHEQQQNIPTRHSSRTSMNKSKF